MEFVKTLLEQQPLMALFLTIAIGYLVGEINVKGFSLGVGAVLFVALAIGWFAPKSVPAPMVGTLGLALFLYAVGVQYGKQFFLGLTSAARAQGEPHRADRRAAGGRREPPVREDHGHEARATRSACSRDRGPARRRCRPPSRRSATTIRRSATRSPIRSAWPGRSCSSTSPSWSSSRRSRHPRAPASSCSKSRCAIPSCPARRSAR